MSGGLKEAFNYNDRAGNGRITYSELDSALRCMGKMHSSAELKSLIEGMNKSENDLFSFDDFSSLNEKIRKDIFNFKEVVISAFKVFDKNEDGYISSPELRHILTTMGEKLSEEEANELIKEADVEGNGRIDYTQFCNRISEAVQ